MKNKIFVTANIKGHRADVVAYTGDFEGFQDAIINALSLCKQAPDSKIDGRLTIEVDVVLDLVDI